MKLKIKRIVTTETCVVIDSNKYTIDCDDVVQTSEFVLMLKKPLFLDDVIIDEKNENNSTLEIDISSDKTTITEAKQ